MKRVIKTIAAPEALGSYSQAILANGLLFISGQIGLKPGDEVLSGDFDTQTRQVFKNIEAVIEAAGGRVIDLMKLTVFVTDLNHAKTFNDIMVELFEMPFPARAMVEVSRLPKGALVEVEAIALLD